MMENLMLLVFCLLLGVGCLVWAGWLVVSHQFATFDGLFLFLVCLVLALISFLNCLWTIRSQEFREWLSSRSRKEENVEAERKAS